jgi:outer membrane immunogenic protein
MLGAAVKRLAIALLTVTCLVGLGQIASAADLPVKAPVYKAPVVVPYNWSGFYVGLNGGYGWGSDDRADVSGGGFWTLSGNGQGQNITPVGGIFGGHIGYNWQVNANWVFGVELSGDWASLKKTDASIYFPTTDSWQSEVNSLMTATGRIGYAVGNWLPYIKGGYAGANLKSSMFDNVGHVLSEEQWRNGWTVGAGLEYAVSQNWTVGAEYDYLDLGSRTWAGFTNFIVMPGGISELIRDKLTINAVLGRISYKFGGGPIVGKY